MILGIDEVGRGPWAGPLVIGAVILPDRFDKDGNTLPDQSWQNDLADSKKLTAKKRKELSAIIQQNAIAMGLGWVFAAELDKIGLSKSLKLATMRAVLALISPETAKNFKELEFSEIFCREINKRFFDLPFSEIIIDGTQNFLEDTPLAKLVSVLPKADNKIKEVSAASIIAKVARDEYMVKLAIKYPDYGFEKHVGYGTAKHRDALKRFGPCPEHRLSFRPIAELVSEASSTRGDMPWRPSAGAPVTVEEDSVAGPRSEPTRSESTSAKGKKAESIVADHLLHRGHTILARNYKTRFYEIDIISADESHIYFTEVKYRKSSRTGTPMEAIDHKKRQQMAFAAESFMKYLSKKLKKSLKNLPSPVLCAASVKGPDFTFDKWLEIGV